MRDGCLVYSLPPFKGLGQLMRPHLSQEKSGMISTDLNRIIEFQFPFAFAHCLEFRSLRDCSFSESSSGHVSNTR